jgi:hypothetical protein
MGFFLAFILYLLICHFQTSFIGSISVQKLPTAAMQPWCHDGKSGARHEKRQRIGYKAPVGARRAVPVLEGIDGQSEV